MPAVSNERWQDAQRSERKFWMNFKLERFRKSVDGSMATAIWARKGIRSPEGDWLDVGIGPLGVSCLHFLGCAGELHVLDPIARVPAEEWRIPEPCKALVRSCHDASSPHVGKAESLPFSDGTFTLAAMENMLDHVEDPALVLQEARRILAPGGQLLLAIDTFSALGEARFRLKTPLKANSDSTFRRAHPHRFSSNGIQRLVSAAGFHITHIDTTTRVGSVVGRGYFTRLIAE
jgi:SAM-dependent methyltransferase